MHVPEVKVIPKYFGKVKVILSELVINETYFLFQHLYEKAATRNSTESQHLSSCYRFKLGKTVP
jgi:hypothetical protein